MVATKQNDAIFLITLPYTPGEKIPDWLRENQDLITEALFKNGVFTNDTLQTQRYGMDTKTVLTLPPTRITVTIKEDSANIHLIK